MTMQITKLKNMPYAQAKIKWLSNGWIILQSYETDVVRVHKQSNVFEITGLYSMTTRKHISAFLKEILPNVSYHTVKLLQFNMLYDITEL